MSPWLFNPCPTCCGSCEACKGKVYPNELTVTLAGIANSNPPGGCTDCPTANGTWALARLGDCLAVEIDGVVQSTQWYQGQFLDVDMCFCGVTPAKLQIDLSITWNAGGVAGRRVLQVVVGNTGQCIAVTFRLQQDDQEEPFDCEALDNISLPYQGAGVWCVSPGATCRVTA